MIKAIPTKYAGRQYRSILEAKYAAWFRLVMDAYPLYKGYGPLVIQYEPEAFDGYIPDFILTRGDRGCLASNIVIEVKGLLESFDLGKIRSSGWSGDIICVDGRGPKYAQFFNGVPRDEHDYIPTNLSTLDVWDFGLLDGRRLPSDSGHGASCWRGIDGYSLHDTKTEHMIFEKLWDTASNLVQWRAPK